MLGESITESFADKFFVHPAHTAEAIEMVYSIESGSIPLTDFST